MIDRRFDRRFARIMRYRSQELVLAGVVEKIITSTQAKALYVAIDGMTKLYITNLITKEQFRDTLVTLVKEVHEDLEAKVKKLIPRVVVYDAPATMQ